MKKLLFVSICIIFLGCTEQKSSSVKIPKPLKAAYAIHSSELSKEAYHNKVLGALVGSAIGDAMGASTEMWHRDAIQLKYGYITGLTPAARPQSPEGTWDNNLPKGSTTDDTRWKLLMTEYFKKEEIHPNSFNDFILDYYQQEVSNLQNKQVLNSTDILDETIEKAKQDQYVETILGRRRYLRNINSKNFTMRGFDERNAINAPIQGSAADIIKIAMINIHGWMKSEQIRSKMIMQVHDELVFDMHKDEQELLTNKVQEFMKEAHPLAVPMEIGLGVGSNWLEAH